MLTSIVSLIAATLKFIWQFVTSPITITLLVIAASIIFFLSGFAFVTVYGMLTLAIVVLGIISMFFSPMRYIVGFVLIVGAMFYLSGQIFPSVENYIAVNFPSYKEWKITSKQLVDTRIAEDTIAMKKEMIASEVIKGTFGIITEDTSTYDEAGMILNGPKLRKGQRIMSLGLQKQAQSETPQGAGTEGMAYVMIPNENGDFIKSFSRLVPIRKIEWDSAKIEPKKIEATPVEKKTETVSVTSIPLSTGLTIGFNHPKNGAHHYKVFTIVKGQTELTILASHSMRFEASSNDGINYSGTWYCDNLKTDGAFDLSFSGQDAVGTFTQDSGQFVLTLAK